MQYLQFQMKVIRILQSVEIEVLPANFMNCMINGNQEDNNKIN